MDAAAGELVALFGAIGRISGVSESLLGATGEPAGHQRQRPRLGHDGGAARMARAALGRVLRRPAVQPVGGPLRIVRFATANHGTIRGIRVDNEIIVLMVCQVCARGDYHKRVPILHGGKISGSPLTGCSFHVTAQILVALVAGSVIFPEPWM